MITIHWIIVLFWILLGAVLGVWFVTTLTRKLFDHPSFPGCAVCGFDKRGFERIVTDQQNTFQKSVLSIHDDFQKKLAELHSIYTANLRAGLTPEEAQFVKVVSNLDPAKVQLMVDGGLVTEEQLHSVINLLYWLTTKKNRQDSDAAEGAS